MSRTTVAALISLAPLGGKGGLSAGEVIRGVLDSKLLVHHTHLWHHSPAKTASAGRGNLQRTMVSQWPYGACWPGEVLQSSSLVSRAVDCGSGWAVSHIKEANSLWCKSGLLSLVAMQRA